MKTRARDSVSANDGGKFRVTKDFYAHDFTTGDDVKLRTGQEVTYVNASDKGFIFKLANGHEIHVRRDDADNISSKPVGDSVSPVPVAGKFEKKCPKCGGFYTCGPKVGGCVKKAKDAEKFANGCPFCKANHDPGIPCRNAQPCTGLTKPQKIERDGKLLGVNMVPVSDASDKCQRCRGTGSIMVRGMDRPERCPMCKGSGKKEAAAKATDSITLSRDESRTLLSVLKTTR